MPKARIPRKYNVFIDSCEFISLNFNTDHASMKALRAAVDEGGVQVLLTEIVKNEVQNNIREPLAAVVTAIAQFAKEDRLKKLRYMDKKVYEALIPTLNAQKLGDDIFQKFENFLKELKVTMLNAYGVDIGFVFDKYFSREAPFNDGKNKHEFPDAFNVQAIEDFCDKNAITCHVVSADKGVLSACATSKGKMIGYDRLTSFLDYHNQIEESGYKFIQKLIDDSSGKIRTEISQEFPARGFNVVDEEGEIENVEVQDVNLINPEIISISDGGAKVSYKVEVFFKADFYRQDYSHAFWDGEDHKWYNVEQEAIELEKEFEDRVEVDLEFDPDLPDEVEVKVGFPYGDVEIYYDEGAKSHYK